MKRRDEFVVTQCCVCGGDIRAYGWTVEELAPLNVHCDDCSKNHDAGLLAVGAVPREPSRTQRPRGEAS